MRYLIASLLTPPSDLDLRKSYQDYFNKPCHIRTLHLTFIPPFTTESKNLNFIQDIVKQIPPLPPIFAPNQPDIFNNTKKILYLPLTPVEPILAIYNFLLPTLKDLISFASIDLPKDKIPDFLPHITLDYDFQDQFFPFSLPQSITLAPPALLYEFNPGIWQPYQS